MVAAQSSCPKSLRMVEWKFAMSELLSLQSYREMQEEQEELRRLSEATGLNNPSLLQRLRDAGFTSQNIHALNWLPIALVAWASQGVSADEVQAANLVKLYALLAGNPAAAEMFELWLEHKPDARLVHLWEDYVFHLTATMPDSQRLQTGQAVLTIARKVAEASGGLFGIGQVSAAEHRVLERVARIYGLASTSEA